MEGKENGIKLLFSIQFHQSTDLESQIGGGESSCRSSISES